MSLPAGGQVRAAGPGDAEQIAAVHVRSWQAAYRGLLPQGYLDRLDPADRLPRWRRTLQETNRASSGVIVVETGSQICGAAWFGPARDPDSDPALVGELIGIYLLPEAWGKGLGRNLMNVAVDGLAAAGYAEATLWVLKSNARARRFYAKAGWAEDGTIKHDDRLGFPITEVRYRRRLLHQKGRPGMRPGGTPGYSSAGRPAGSSHVPARRMPHLALAGEVRHPLLSCELCYGMT